VASHGSSTFFLINSLAVGRLEIGLSRITDGSSPKSVTCDEARRIAANVAKLPELLSR
jgi:hypothetical protein